MEKYFYEGPIKLFDQIIVKHVEDYTVASSEKKARANLTFRYKRLLGYESSAKISMPGKLTIVDTGKDE